MTLQVSQLDATEIATKGFTGKETSAGADGARLAGALLLPVRVELLRLGKVVVALAGPLEGDCHIKCAQQCVRSGPSRETYGSKRGYPCE